MLDLVDWLQRAIESRTSMCLGELAITWDGDEAIVRHAQDQEAVEQVPAEPAAIRQRVRFDDAGRYRPLPGAMTLPTGWHVRCAPGQLPAVLEAIYPLVPAHLAQAERGTLRTATMDEVLDRQGGRYDVAGELSSAGRQAAVDVLCAHCVKTPVWDGDLSGTEGHIPCPEPCSVMVALCRELAIAADDQPLPEPDPSVGFAAFEEPENPIRVACLSRLRDRSEIVE